jgi:hypothetical protein
MSSHISTQNILMNGFQKVILQTLTRSEQPSTLTLKMTNVLMQSKLQERQQIFHGTSDKIESVISKQNRQQLTIL